MKESTKALKAEARKDIEKMFSKHSKNESGLNDRKKFYRQKWTAKKASAETDAQKQYAENVLTRIEYLR